MNVFSWDALFETGVELIDSQHKRLVDIINRLGDALVSDRAESALIEALFKELANYAQMHFADEERLMSAARLDPQYFESHRSKHLEFVDQLTAMRASQGDARASADRLLGYLAGWLTFHILEEDKAMVARFRAAAGSASRHAAITPAVPEANTNAVLLASMRKLYRALADSNAQLDIQVRERTRDLLQTEKMAAIGQLAAGVAHEINNPLGFVTSNLGTLRQWTCELLEIIYGQAASRASGDDASAGHESTNGLANLSALRSELGPLLAETEDGLRRVRDVVHALQHFSGDHLEEARECDLLEGLESALMIVAGAHRDRVRITRDLSPLPPVRCAPGAINQVFMNLLLNAIQAMPDRGAIALRSGSDDTGVWIEIADTGCGIRPEHLQRVFEPFFSTRPVGKGMGLGLTAAWDTVVNQHGGRIDVRSAPGAGASFTIRLPRSRAVLDAAGAARDPAMLDGT